MAAATKQEAVDPVVPLQAHPFPHSQIRLSDGLFKHAMELDQGYLLALPIERLLHNFYLQAGLPSTAKPLGGWEDPQCELRGHFVGHYLSACALMYAATGDRRFQARGDSVVAGLHTCQETIGTGYLSAFPIAFIDRVETQNKVWAPYYTLHKIMAGLLDMYVYADNELAFVMARKFADWIFVRNQRLSDEEMQKMLNIEHGGMNESFANLYAYINLFTASRSDWPSVGLQVMQETRFPEQSFTELHFACDHPRRFKVCLRYPAWARSGVSVLINKRPHKVAQKPGSWIILDRVWSSDDQITLHLPLALSTESFRDNPNRLAFLAGGLYDLRILKRENENGL